MKIKLKTIQYEKQTNRIILYKKITSIKKYKPIKKTQNNHTLAIFSLYKFTNKTYV